MPEQDTYRMAPGTWRHLGQGAEIFVSGLSGEGTSVDPRLAALLRDTPGFQALQALSIAGFARGHAGAPPFVRAARVLLSTLRAAVTASDAPGLGSVRGIESALGHLARAGVLVSRAQVLERLRAPRASPVETPRLGGLGILTAHRPATLARCLESYLGHGTAETCPEAILVIDDSAPSQAPLTRDVIARAQTSPPRRIHYVGHDDKRAIARTLAAAAGVAPELLEFALCGDPSVGFTAGGSRNALLLLGAGQRVLSVDDDTICRPGLLSSRTREAAIAASTNDPRRHRLFADRAAALHGVAPAALDVFAAHHAVLGRPVSEVLLRQGAPDIEAADDLMLVDLWRGAGTVVLSANGLVGHSGARFAGSLFLDPPGEPVPSESDYRSGIESQSMAAEAAALVVSNRSYCAAGFLGIDGTELGVPFLPSLRGEDELFGRLLAQCRREAYSAHLPFVLPHDPPEPRVEPLERLVDDVALPFSVVIGDRLASATLSPVQDPAVRLASLGRHLIDWSSLDDDDLTHACWMHFLERAAQRLCRLDQARAAARKAPAFWTRAVERRMAALRSAATAEPSWALCGLVANDARPPARVARRLLKDFGELLVAWPGLFEAALRARTAGGLLPPRRG